MKPNVLILHANGTNRDRDVAAAFALAGAVPEIMHLSQLRAGERHFADYQILVVPGGFSYGDALGAGRLFALDLQTYFADQLQAFVAADKLVLGICNGFQALVKAGVLPGGDRSATLTYNERGHFECRWVHLKPQASRSRWLPAGSAPIFCPVAHGEGRFICADPAALHASGQVALTYATESGDAAGGAYPTNPNGSPADIAGVCNPAGNVLGLMPHPENHIYAQQHPNWTRGEQGHLGLQLFVNGVQCIS